MTETEKLKGGPLSRNVKDVQNIMNTANAIEARTSVQRTVRSRRTKAPTEAMSAGYAIRAFGGTGWKGSVQGDCECNVHHSRGYVDRAPSG